MSDRTLKAQRAITDKEFDELLEVELKHLNNFFLKPRTGYIAQLNVALRNDFDAPLDVAVVGLSDGSLSDDPDERFKIFMGLGAKFWQERSKQGAPVAVMFSSEAWAKEMNKKDTDSFMRSNKRVSQLPDKKEVLVTYGMTIDGRKSMAMHSISRNKKGEIDKIKLTLYAPYTNGKQPAAESDLVSQFFKGVKLAMEG